MDKEKAKLNYERHVALIKKRQGQGYEKLKLYYEELIKSEFLQRKCNWIRLVNDIPDNGYPNSIPDGAIDWVDFISLPKKWLKRHDNDEDWEKLQAYIQGLCDELGLYDYMWHIIIQNHLFYDKLPSPENLKHENFDLCQIRDEIQIGKSLESLSKEKKYRNAFLTLLYSFEREFEHFPVTIGVSPYASERDIIDFIKKNFKEIKSIQGKYESKDIRIGKIRKKKPKVAERNEFIYNHGKLPYKEIMCLVTKKFGECLDYGHIGKIISLEQQRRLIIAGKHPKNPQELRKLQNSRK